MGDGRATGRTLTGAQALGAVAAALSVLAAVTAVAALLPALGGAATLVNPRVDPAAIYERARPGVVTIRVVSIVNSYFGPRQVEGEGSGFILDTKGDIATNQHVVAGADTIEVRLSDGKTVTARLVGADASTDIAVIRIDPAGRALRPLVLGDSAKIRPGRSVVALGSPYGLDGTITEGIISGIGRTITAPDRTPITGVLQTDAAINEGNSGGPLIDASGKVIGMIAQINSKSGGSEGVGFAIPSNTVRRVVARLLATAATAARSAQAGAARASR